MADKNVAGLTSSTPTIDDLTISYDNADTSELKKTTWQLVRDLFKTYFDTIYQAILVSGTNIKTVNGTSLLGSGDITISGGVSIATDTIWDAKGDLAIGTGANTAIRLAVGTNGQVLTADSAEATGTKWATVAGTGDMLKSENLSGLANYTTARSNLGLGSLATQSGTFSGTSSGTNTGDQTITLTGDVTGGGTGSFATTIPADTVTFAKMQNVNTNRILGRSTAGTGDIEELNVTAVPALIGLGTSDSPQFTGVNIGNATDTTITRVSAGVVAVEGVTVPTISSTSTLTNKTITKPIIQGSVQNIQTISATVGGTTTLDCSLYNGFIVNLGGNTTMAISNATVGQHFWIQYVQDATGSRTVTQFITIKWAGGTAPTLTTTATKKDWVGHLCTSAGNYDGVLIAQNI